MHYTPAFEENVAYLPVFTGRVAVEDEAALAGTHQNHDFCHILLLFRIFVLFYHAIYPRCASQSGSSWKTCATSMGTVKGSDRWVRFGSVYGSYDFFSIYRTPSKSLK